MEISWLVVVDKRRNWFAWMAVIAVDGNNVFRGDGMQGGRGTSETEKGDGRVARRKGGDGEVGL